MGSEVMDGGGSIGSCDARPELYMKSLPLLSRNGMSHCHHLPQAAWWVIWLLALLFMFGGRGGWERTCNIATLPLAATGASFLLQHTFIKLLLRRLLLMLLQLLA